MSTSINPIRPKAALAFILSAVFLAGGLVAATVAWYFTVESTTGEAHGGTAAVTFAGCAEARPVIEARLADYGLPAAPKGDFSYEIGLPGLPDDLDHVPSALTAPGVLEVQVKGAVAPTQIDQVGVQLAFSGTPVTLIMLKEPISKESVTAKVDGQEVEIEAVNGQELQLAARAGQSTEALRIATDRAVSLRHPLPCAVTVVSARRVP